MRLRGIVVSEVNEPALVIPHVLAVNTHIGTLEDRRALADRDVVLDEDGLRGSREANDETLVHTGLALSSTRTCVTAPWAVTSTFDRFSA